MLVGKFEDLKKKKREEGFDMANYFSILEQIQKSHMPLMPTIIEDAKEEAKREKWIKKYNDIQTLAAKSNSIG